MNNLHNNALFKMNKIASKLESLESHIYKLEEKIDKAFAIQRNHLIKVKNHEELSDEFIQSGFAYSDLSPQKAWRFFNNHDLNFLFIDVSHKDHKPIIEIPELVKIPLEELSQRLNEISGKNVPILIISEDGTRSILACELLNKLDYYNVNNISGGYKFWPGIRLKQSA